MNDNLIFLLAIIVSVVAGAYLHKFIRNLNNKNEKDLFDERLKQSNENLESLEKTKNEEIKRHETAIEVLNAKLVEFDIVKANKIKLEVSIKNVEKERNDLKDENTTLKKDEDIRINESKKAIDSANILIKSVEKEKERLNDERVEKERSRLEALKETWNNHEKDVENHIRLLCKNNVVSYIEQNDFPYAGKKPDNTIEILEQYIIFDAKSPANEDLNNFPKYLKTQTENLKKYAKHENVKNDLFLVIPSNTLSVIKEFTYNIGDYNVYVISKDSLEPIILSLKKIEEYEFADKLSPEERDDICRIIGKFAHTTKRKIQIEMYFMEEFLDILKKSKNLLPKEILKRVIEFENAVKLNPPMEKRKKQILTKDLIDDVNQIKKEIELREIPQIESKIIFKEDK
ncbi:MAG: hypothetical protein DRI75_08935 [Bacteroidetes bacterium]|nr:MAG: hypothetical protein DRI75_08935 [Bacteroidota bacterium]